MYRVKWATVYGLKVPKNANYYRYKPYTVNPQKRPAGLSLSLRVQTRVLLEFCRIFVFLPIVF